MIKEEQVFSIEDRIAKATIDKDIETLDYIYSEDYCYSNSKGFLITKEYLINIIKDELVKYDEIKLDNVQVRIYGDTAILNGRLIEKGCFETIEFNEIFRVIRVYIKEEERIRVVGFQLTKIEE